MDSKSSEWTVVSHKKKQQPYNGPQQSSSLSSFGEHISSKSSSSFKVQDTSCEYEKITIKRNGQTKTYF